MGGACPVHIDFLGDSIKSAGTRYLIGTLGEGESFRIIMFFSYAHTKVCKKVKVKLFYSSNTTVKAFFMVGAVSSSNQ